MPKGVWLRDEDANPALTDSSSSGLGARRIEASGSGLRLCPELPGQVCGPSFLRLPGHRGREKAA